MTVAILAVQAAITWWDYYKDAATAAAERSGEAFKKMDDAARAAREENERFFESLADGEAVTSRISGELAEQTAILNAQTKAKKELLKADEEAEMAKAQTPEEKSAVRSKYRIAEDTVDAGARQAHIKELDDMLYGMFNLQKVNYAQRGRIVEGITGAEKAGDSTRVEVLNKELEKKDKEIEALTNQYQHLYEERNTAKSVNAIETAGNVMAHNRSISAGVEASDAMQHGQRLTQAQIEANRQLTALFAEHTGGIETMLAIMKEHFQHTTTLAQETTAMKNALTTLSQTVQAIRVGP